MEIGGSIEILDVDLVGEIMDVMALKQAVVDKTSAHSWHIYEQPKHNYINRVNP